MMVVLVPWRWRADTLCAFEPGLVEVVPCEEEVLRTLLDVSAKVSENLYFMLAKREQ